MVFLDHVQNLHIHAEKTHKDSGAHCMNILILYMVQKTHTGPYYRVQALFMCGVHVSDRHVNLQPQRLAELEWDSFHFLHSTRSTALCLIVRAPWTAALLAQCAGDPDGAMRPPRDGCGARDSIRGVRDRLQPSRDPNHTEWRVSRAYATLQQRLPAQYHHDAQLVPAL